MTVPSESTTEKPATRAHLVGGGIAVYQFFDDLKIFYNRGAGVFFNYDYLIEASNFEARVGAELLFLQAVKDNFVNQHFMLVPHYKMLWPFDVANKSKFKFGYFVGLEIDYWRQKFKDLPDILNDDIYYNLKLAPIFSLPLRDNMEVELLFAYHLQQFDFKLPYVSAQGSLLWKL